MNIISDIDKKLRKLRLCEKNQCNLLISLIRGSDKK
jgi:hypothetical protein